MNNNYENNKNAEPQSVSRGWGVRPCPRDAVLETGALRLGQLARDTVHHAVGAEQLAHLRDGEGRETRLGVTRVAGLVVVLVAVRVLRGEGVLKALCNLINNK